MIKRGGTKAEAKKLGESSRRGVEVMLKNGT